jgi:hypothetical protein
MARRTFKNGTAQVLITAWVPEATIAQLNALVATGAGTNRTNAIVALIDRAFRQQFGIAPIDLSSVEDLEGVA